MKKFLVFLLIVFLVVAVVAGAGWYFFYSNGIAVFVETFDHGYLTVDSKNIEGTRTDRERCGCDGSGFHAAVSDNRLQKNDHHSNL